MSDDIVKFKGIRSGLQLIFAEQASFAAIEQEIRGKLESEDNFFCRGTVVYIAPDSLTAVDREKLKKIFRQYGVICRESEPANAPPRPAALAKAVALAQGKDESVQRMTVINKTLRGGQEVRTENSVLVFGNVNPGAQIIAGGSIDIRGTCRGVVHAGYPDDESACIVADHLMPVQIRIAGRIARSPDIIEKTEQAEKASIKDGQIVIEPIERQENR